MLAALLALALAATDVPREYRLGPDGWQEVPRAAATAPSAATRRAANDGGAALARLQTLFDRNRPDDARRGLVEWFAAHPASPAYDEALYLMARTLAARGERYRAFYYCDQLLDQHPDSPRFNDALDLQYAVAEQYLRGQRERFLLVFRLARYEEGVEMLFRIQQRAPRTELAERSLLRSADHYWARGEYDLAADVYGAFARSYPRSPFADEARLRQAYSNLAQFNGPRFDPKPVLDAQAQLARLAADNPRLAREAQIDDRLALADRQLARRLWLAADYYKRVRKPDAARHLYERIVRDHPRTPEAERALTFVRRPTTSEAAR